MQLYKIIDVQREIAEIAMPCIWPRRCVFEQAVSILSPIS